MASRRHPPRHPRGQTLVLGALTLLVAALMVVVTVTLSLSLHQKVKLQNYADAKAFSTAVAEARALNYFAKTNRSIASAYVGMANLHAYISEAGLLSDLQMGAAGVMFAINLQELELCYCTDKPECGPVHCEHALEAQLNAAGLVAAYSEGEIGKRLQSIDSQAEDTVQAFHQHIDAIHASQEAVRQGMYALLDGAPLGKLKEHNMQESADKTQDLPVVGQLNRDHWDKVFLNDLDIKRRIMAETVNASRQDFAWNRDGGNWMVFRTDWLMALIKTATWVGPDGEWYIMQVADNGTSSGGRTAYTSGLFPGQAGSDVSAAEDADPYNSDGRSCNSFDWGYLVGTWRHGTGTAVLPVFGAAGPSEFLTGLFHRHQVNAGATLNQPHDGTSHDTDQRMYRFMEFNIGTAFPYNQPFVYSAAATDTRREALLGADEPVTFTGLSGEQGELWLQNANRARAVSKAMVYYHRMGDWSDLPNLFNPYWRAKLQPFAYSEARELVGTFDPESAELLEGAESVTLGRRAVNLE